MEIKISTLKFITDKLFDHLVKFGVESINIEDDYYWHIPKEEIYDLDDNPKNLNLGQISDDWNDLLKLMDDQRYPLMTDFSDLAVIFRVIGEIDEVSFVKRK